MMEFDSPGAFAAHLQRVLAALPQAERAGLKAGIEIIQIEAQDMLGEYQTSDTGQFAPWEPLSEVTTTERREQGYSEDEPLKRAGVLQENIESTVGDRDAATGVPDRMVDFPYADEMKNIGDIAVDLELGTQHMAPRSFLGVAGFRKGRDAAEEVASHVAWTLAGRPIGAKRNGRGDL